MLNKLRKPGFRRCSPSSASTQAGGRKPGALGSVFWRMAGPHLVFPAMNIYGLSTDLRTHRTQSDLATGTLDGPPVVSWGIGTRGLVWASSEGGDARVQSSAVTRLRRLGRRSRGSPPFLSGKGTLPEVSFIPFPGWNGAQAILTTLRGNHRCPSGKALEPQWASRASGLTPPLAFTVSLPNRRKLKISNLCASVRSVSASGSPFFP